MNKHDVPKSGVNYVKVNHHMAKTLDELRRRWVDKGATVNFGPNVPRLLEIRNLSTEFAHDESALTAKDCLMVLGSASVGTDVDGAVVSEHAVAVIGTPVDNIYLLVRLMEVNPMLLSLFKTAVAVAEERISMHDVVRDFEKHAQP